MHLGTPHPLSGQSNPFAQTQNIRQLTAQNRQNPNFAALNQIFQQELGRDIGQEGLEFFSGDLAGGQSLADVEKSVRASLEAQQRSLGLSAGPLPTGLIGSEQALQQGQQAATAALTSAQTGGLQALQQGQEAFDPFLQAGQQAGDIQAALSGALGQQSQQQALANLQPVNDFLQQQGERSVLRNQAALGGLGGGNVQKELVRFGQGLAGQSAQQQFQNLGDIATRGFGAAQGVSGLGQAEAGFRRGIGGDIASATLGTGQQLAAGRQRAGEGIASAVGGTTSALSQLLNQQGGGVSDIIGGTTSNLANLLAGAGQQAGGANEQLATILANLATQQASQTAGLPGLPGVQQSGGILGGIGQAAGGVGTLIGSLAPAAPVVAASDVRLKENIVPAGVSAGGHNLYSWDWNEDGKRIAGEQPTFGVLAQEVRAIDPDAVHVGADGFLRVDYKRIH